MSPRDRRALVTGAAVVGLALAILKLVPWGWRAVSERRAELDARAGLLQQMRAEVGSVASLEDSGPVVKARLAMLVPRLLTGRTAGQAEADLGARLTKVAGDHRVRVSRTDRVESSAEGGQLRRVTLRAMLESDTRGLFGFLDAVRRDSVVLVVSSVRAVVDDPLVPPDQPELLRTELTFHGWFLQRTVSP